MRNVRLAILLVLLTVTLIAAGCSSQGKVADQYSNPSLEGAPSWVLMPADDSGMIAATGSAAKGPAGLSFQRTEAMADARDALARQLEVRVKNAFNKTVGQAGIGETASVDAFSENISRQCAKSILVGSKQKDAWIAKDGTLYVLVVLDSNQAAEAAKKNISSYMNKEALWQRFQHEKAQKDFQANFESEFKSFEN